MVDTLSFETAHLHNILRIQAIKSFDAPELAPYATLRYELEHRQRGIFVAEGENSVRRLIASTWTMVSMVVPEHLLEIYQPLIAARGADIPLYVAPKKLLETLTGFSMYQGVMAVGKIPASLTLETFLERAAHPLLLIAADGISNAQNIGALTRNCGAFSASALVVDPRSCSPFLRRAVSASAGTIFSVPVIELENLPNALRELRTRGIRCIGAHPSAKDNPIFKASLVSDCCLVMGSEGPGISQEALAECDDLLSIPMPPHIDSLNVASASAIFLYEAVRQRNEGLLRVRRI